VPAIILNDGTQNADKSHLCLLFALGLMVIIQSWNTNNG
jgi:hypothetical protein